jgi:hypothetical protein
MDNIVLHYNSENELQVSDKSEIDITNESCSICYESIDSKQSYTLPCNHAFHTDCIIEWFRTGNPSCPYCRNTNNNQDSDIICISAKSKWKVKFLRNYSRRKNAPIILIKHVKQLRKEEQNLKIYNAELKDVNNKKGILKDLIKNRRNVFIKKWKCYRKIREYKKTLLELNIIPLIVKK